MNVSIVADVLLIAAAVVWILARQVQVGRVKPRLLWLVPLLLAFFGIRSLPSSTWHVPADLGLLAVSAVISIGLGIWRGQTIRVWRDADGTWWRQGSALTLVLWGALIVARGLIYGVGVAVGHREATNLGAILVVAGAELRRAKRRHRAADERRAAALRRPAGRASRPRHGRPAPACCSRRACCPPARTHPRPPARTTRAPGNAQLGVTRRSLGAGQDGSRGAPRQLPGMAGECQEQQTTRDGTYEQPHSRSGRTWRRAGT